MIRIGYTTGVFDLFHIGHVNLLRRSRENCDRLIVGVTTDELTLQRKGRLPVVPFEERIAIVADVRYVDQAVPHEHMDRMRTWNELRYHVMFKGDDWAGTPEWKALEGQLRDVGVEVVFFPYTKGQASSLLRPHALSQD